MGKLSSHRNVRWCVAKPRKWSVFFYPIFGSLIHSLILLQEICSRGVTWYVDHDLCTVMLITIIYNRENKRMVELNLRNHYAVTTNDVLESLQEHRQQKLTLGKIPGFGMARMPTKGCSTSPVPGEMQAKTMMRYRSVPIKTAKINNRGNTKCW